MSREILLEMIGLSCLAIIIGSYLWRQKIKGLEKLKKARATSPEEAVKPEEAGISRLEKICMVWGCEEVKSTKDGRYYAQESK